MIAAEQWEPPEWITPGTDLSFLPSWTCGGCGQTNSGWARECGRCENSRPMDPESSEPRP